MLSVLLRLSMMVDIRFHQNEICPVYSARIDTGSESV